MLEYWLAMGGELVRLTGRLDRTQWTIVSSVVFGIGLLCVRGFGSRKNY